MLSQRASSKELPKGIDSAWHAAMGFAARLNKRKEFFLERAEKVLSWDKHFSNMPDSKLRQSAREFRDLFRLAKEAPEDLERAFALVREVAFRQLGEKPYHVQVAGALAIEAGCIAEMATGEGKTLTATMPATIHGWRGRGCHVLTTNDYLAKRDAEWMNKVYGFCNLRAAHVEGAMEPPERRMAYQADITYGTNKEVAADFLRDRLALGRLRSLSSALLAKIADGSGSGTDRLVMRGLHYAIVDEADSVLIDEAVTPLIISGEAPNPQQVEAFEQAVDLAEDLQHERDYTTNDRYREVKLTDQGMVRLGELAEPLGGIWHGRRRREEMVSQALTARHYFLRDKQYIINDEKVVIVDEFTGRLMPDREWRDGLHQAVSAKEKVEIQPPKDTYARISFQRFFRMYRQLAGMTGTATEATREFWQIYNLPVVVIPTNKPCIREQWPQRILKRAESKWSLIVSEIRHIHEQGRPVLIGTRSVRASEYLSQLLIEQGLVHEVLNATRHAEEAQIVAGAGQEGKITVATNMAGRGTDIKLGRGITEKGGLHVIATERHESGRVDRQLYGRAGRQGDPGSCQAIVSLEDELVCRHLPFLTSAVSKRHGEDGEIVSKFAKRVFSFAQLRAQRMALSQRKGVLRSDDWLDEYLGFAGKE